MKVFLILHRGALGDFVLTWPTLAALRRKYRHHRFLAIGRPDHLELATALGLIDAWIDCETAALLPFHSGEALPEVLEGLDAALLWTQENLRLYGLLQSVCSGPVVFHPPFPSEKDGEEIHVLKHHLRCLSRFSTPSIQEEEPYFSFSSRGEMAEGAKEKGYALVHPGSGSPSKNYSADFYAEVARSLLRKGYDDVRIVLGPAEKSMRACYAGRFPIEEPACALGLGELLTGAALFIGNDSGASHLAASLGIWTLALYKSGNSAQASQVLQWGVRGRASRTLIVKDEADARRRLDQALQEGRFPAPDFSSKGFGAKLLSQPSWEVIG